MNAAQTLNYRLFGTLQPPVEAHSAVLGDLQFIAEGSHLRRLCADGREIMRSVGLVIRDGFWGTHNLLQQHCETRAESQSWRRQVDGVVLSADETPALNWRVDMNISSDRLAINATLQACTDFSTCRAGLMLLHPLHGVVGSPVVVEHSDGQQEHAAFPDLISPGQPFFDIRRLKHSPAPGLELEWHLSGDVFEMEDQRNWSDASFKTYNRPLAWPCPYVIPAGDCIEQGIELRLLRNQERRS